MQAVLRYFYVRTVFSATAFYDGFFILYQQITKNIASSLIFCNNSNHSVSEIPLNLFALKYLLRQLKQVFVSK